MKNFFLQLFTWWNGQTLGTRFYTWRKGERVGEDELGNVYYRSSDDRRWVIYAGLADPSSVSAVWHGWLHHTQEEPPDTAHKGHDWELAHKPNMTGTAQAYRPAGSILSPAHRPQATGDYQPWSPK